MAKRKRVGRCVHCLRTVKGITRDHVLPKSWYPESTPANLERWTAPACSECNEKFGNLERFLFVAFMLCFDPDDPEFSGLVAKARRMIDPKSATSEQEALHRAGLRGRVMSRIGRATDAPDHAIIPGFGRHEGVPYEEELAIGVRPEELMPVVEKVVRGLTHYHGDGAYIEESHKVAIRLEQEEDLPELAAVARRDGETSERGAGIHVIRAAQPEDPASGIFRITIWNKFGFFAVVERG